MKQTQSSLDSSSETSSKISSSKGSLRSLKVDRNWRFCGKGYGSYGKTVADYLSLMPPHMALLTLNVINDVIYQAKIGKLKRSSRIATDKENPLDEKKED